MRHPAPRASVHLRVAVLFASLAGVVAGCGPVEQAPARVAETGQEIIGGTVANGDPAVVALAQQYQGKFYQYCTGTLIAPKTVLTAAHCVDPNVTAWAVIGTYVASPQQWVQVAQQIAHPSFDGQTLIADIAVLRLSTAVTNVTPIAINTTPLTTADVGRSIRHVGFGVDDALRNSGNGTKREVTYTIRQVTDTRAESGADGRQTCFGDSGGPGFMVMPGSVDEVVAGVVSYGDQSCAVNGWDTRVDAYATWVQQTMAPWEEPTCAADGKCKTGCTPIDVDCACIADGVCGTVCPDVSRDPDCPKDCAANGVCSQQACPWPDADCHDEGTACTTDLDCVSRVCVGDPQHSGTYCSRPCTTSSECAISGMECASDGSCQWQQKSTAGIGEGCTTETYCLASTICAGDSLSDLHCQWPCSGEGAQCPSDSQTCTRSATGAWYCKAPAPPDAGSSGPKQLVLPRANLEAGSAAGCSSSGGAPLWAGGLLFAFALVGRRRRKLALAVAAAATVASGCGTDRADEASARYQSEAKEIVGGSTDSADPEVFELFAKFSNGIGSLCTATLIGNRTLVTAAHCVDASLQGAGVQLNSLRATNKTDANKALSSDWYTAAEWRIHPGWDPKSPGLNDDIAMVLLQRAPAAPKKPWNEADIITYQGKPIRAVGYGITSNSSTATDSGIKRQVDLVINSVDLDHLYLGDGSGKGICHGDSGGPSFHTFSDGVERLVGVHSYDANGECTSGGDIRIDAYASFVNQWLSEKEGPQCGNDGQCKTGCSPVDADCYCVQDGTCNAQCPDLSRDPDCPLDCIPNGVCATAACPVPDVDCVSLGGACTSADQCVTRVCTSDPQHASYCSQRCALDSECPSGMHCVTSVCQYEQTPPSQVVLGRARFTPQSLASGCASAGGGPLAALLFALGGLLNRRHNRPVSR